MQALCAASELILSAVTASNTLAVAQEAAPFIRPGTVFLDLNSASPGTKQQCAALIDAAGGHYVEAGVMTSVPPYGIKVPMLLGGARAAALAPVLTGWGMDAKAVSDRIGVASAIKMCRSVMIKGLEALVIESYSTARAYGVEDHVLPTLQETFPSIDWSTQGAYFFSRVVQHGQRRAEEMREAANTVREAGFEPFMASAIADKQQWVADQAKAGVFAGVGKGQSSAPGRTTPTRCWPRASREAPADSPPPETAPGYVFHMLDILAITGPIYITIALGYFLTRRGLFARADMRVLGQFVINLALPALLFNALAQRKLADILNGRYLLVYALGSLVTMGLGLLWARRGARQDPTTSVFWAMGMSCPNSGFVGYPIALLVIGPVAGVMLGLNMIVENLLLIPLLLALAESSTGSGGRWHAVLRQSLVNLARNPMVLGLLAGFACRRWNGRCRRRWRAP